MITLTYARESKTDIPCASGVHHSLLGHLEASARRGKVQKYGAALGDPSQSSEVQGNIQKSKEKFRSLKQLKQLEADS